MAIEWSALPYVGPELETEVGPTCGAAECGKPTVWKLIGTEVGPGSESVWKLAACEIHKRETLGEDPLPQPPADPNPPKSEPTEGANGGSAATDAPSSEPSSSSGAEDPAAGGGETGGSSDTSASSPPSGG